MNRYIEHIINDLVRDTRINYEKGRIYFPFSLLSFIPFSKYCKDTYGLTEEEIDYVWNQYKGIIKDKFTNR